MAERLPTFEDFSRWMVEEQGFPPPPLGTSYHPGNVPPWGFGPRGPRQGPPPRPMRWDGPGFPPPPPQSPPYRGAGPRLPSPSQRGGRGPGRGGPGLGGGRGGPYLQSPPRGPMPPPQGPPAPRVPFVCEEELPYYYNEVDYIKKQGNEALKKQDFQLAVQHYSSALQLLRFVPQNDELVATLLSNRSQANFKMGHLDIALQDAEGCISLRPGWNKGYWRAGVISKASGHVEEAIVYFVNGYDKAELSARERCDFLKEIVMVVNSARQNMGLLYELVADKPLWGRVVSALGTDNAWTEVKLLMMGTDEEEGLADGCKLSNFSLAGLIAKAASCDWVVPLAIVLLQHGVGPECLVASQDTPVLHAVMRMTMDAGNVDLLKYLFRVYATDVESRNMQDGNGNTLLHLLCSVDMEPDWQELLVKVLVNNNIRASTRNKDGRRAAELLPSANALRQHLDRTAAMQGLSLKDQMNHLKGEGNSYHGKGHYAEAVECFDLAIEMLNKLGEQERKTKGISNRDAAVLYSNRSDTYYKLGAHDAAFKDAKKCVKMDTSWFKGHVRLGKILREQENAEKALCAYQAALECCKKMNDPILKSEIATEITRISTELASDNPLHEAVRQCNVSPEVWTQVVLRLTKTEPREWYCVLMLAVCKRLIGCDLYKLNYTELLQMPAVPWNQWGEKLVIEFLEQNGNVARITTSEGDSPLHAAVDMAKKTDSTLLFKFLVSSRYMHKRRTVNYVDSLGDSVLHKLSRWKILENMPNIEVMMIGLLQHTDIDVLIENKEGKRALDYLENVNHLHHIVNVLTKEALEKVEAKKREEERKAQEAKKRQEQQQRKKEQQLKKEQQRKEQQQKRQAEAARQKELKPEDLIPRLEGAVGLQDCKSCLSSYTRGADLMNRNKLMQAMETFCHIFGNDIRHHREAHHIVGEEAMAQVYGLYDKGKDDVPNCLMDMPVSRLRELILKLTTNSRWHKACFLLEEYRTKFLGKNYLPPIPDRKCLATDAAKNAPKKVHSKAEDSLASGVCLHSFVSGNYSRGNPPQRYDHLELLLQFRAPPEGIQKNALRAAMVSPDFKAARFLVYYGADPAQVTLQEGDTPLHAALEVGLEREKGYFELLEILLQTHESFKKAYTCLHPLRFNLDGDTVFHVAAQVKYSGSSRTAVEILCKYNVNPNVPNRAGKLVIDCLPKAEDRRAQYIRMAAGKFGQPKEAARKNKSEKSPENEVGNGSSATPDNWEDGDANKIILKKAAPGRKNKGKKKIAIVAPKPKVLSEQEQTRKWLKEKIEDLPDAVYDKTIKVSDEEVSAAAALHSDHNRKDNVEKLPLQGEFGIDREGGNGDLLLPDDVDQVIPGEEAVFGQEDVGDEEEEQNEEIEPDVFDNLMWDVECTAEVWKVLRDKGVPFDLKRRTIRKIQLLASGEWGKSLRYDLKNPKHIKLFEIRLSKGSRVVWELAIAFSPRLSETAESRLGLEVGTMHGAKGGRIYSEIIRVWDIVLDHDKLHHAVQRIVNSHGRGEECIIQKNLRGIERRKFTAGNVVTKRIPALFTEVDDTAPVVEEGPKFMPPASANKAEFHIMKFYSFSSSLVNNVLHHIDAKVDFPFRVTELEHAIIHLTPHPPAPILLLGRSGTGKTTCCLYRLWNAFVQYWQHATDGPWIPRCITYVHQDPVLESEENGDTEGEDTSSQNSEDPCQDSETLKSSLSQLCQAEGTTVSDDTPMDHLHQVFVTKNAVLCSEVQKNFRELSHGCDEAHEHVEVEDNPLPARFQDAHPAAYPIFVTSRQFLLILDASLNAPHFFERDEDGSLLRDVPGWTESDTHLTFIPDLELQYEENDPEEGQAEDVGLPGDEEAEQGQGQGPGQRGVDPRKEVTYEMFALTLWPKMRGKNKSDYHPSLVWMEITSYIKGSVEALSTEKGFLSREDYKSLGRKRAPNFTGDRDRMYELFLQYCHLKQHNGLYDEADLVFQLYKRMQGVQAPDWVIHQLYVDETQDFTQAELCLLIRCCHSPNHMFLTGDTAQSIMRGVAFRFDDLKTLFYYARQSMRALGKTSAVEVPRRVYRLIHNYRSHAGILRLAASVVDLMSRFFPESFDRLQKDQGLFEGPKPLLLESCSVGDLALLLRGSQRETSQIEFGAHQAILVANDQARENLPEELSLGLVLTIFESKGLEFDDILLYNFFKDSHAQKEWRVVTEHLNALLEQQQSMTTTSSLQEIDLDILNDPSRPRPLKFDQDRHKVLNAELKHLYTALTRARVNVWIFDEDNETRAPMFEYFKALNLVQVIRNEDGIHGEDLAELVFAEGSTPEQWHRRGDEFYKHRLYPMAAKCYSKSGDHGLETLSLAQARAVKAAQMRDNPRKLREEFLLAAQDYMQCSHQKEAAKCLLNAREFELAARLMEKTGQTKMAATLYTKLHQIERASNVFETSLNFRQAVLVLVNNSRYDEAVDVLLRYQMMVKDYKREGRALPVQLTVPNERYTVENLCYNAAKLHHKEKHKKRMIEVLDRLPNLKDKVDFLFKHHYIDEAAPDMIKMGRWKEVGKHYRDAGRIKDALKYVTEQVDEGYHAECLLALARKKMINQELGFQDDEMLWGNSVENISQDDVNELLTKCLELFQKCKNPIGVAEAQLLMGMKKKKLYDIQESWKLSHRESFLVCVVHSLDEIIQWEGLNLSLPDCQRICDTLGSLLQLVKSLWDPRNRAEHNFAEQCRKFYGLETSGTRYKVLQHEGARIILTHAKTKLNVSIEKDEVVDRITYDLLTKAKFWIEKCQKYLEKAYNQNKQCEVYIVGNKCTNIQCPNLHAQHKAKSYKDLLTAIVCLVSLEELIQSIGEIRNMSKNLSLDFLALKLNPTTSFVEKMYCVLFPKHIHPRILSIVPQAVGDLFRLVRTRTVVSAVERHTKTVWNTLKRDERHRLTDVLIQIQLLHSLFSCKEQLAGWLAKEEKDLKVELSKHAANQYIKEPLGFHLQRRKELLILNFFRPFFYINQKLYQDGQAMEAMAQFNHLLCYTAKHGRQDEKFLPSISNTIMLMELQLTLALSIILCHHCRTATVILPASYLALVNFWDGIHVQSNPQYCTMYECILKWKPPWEPWIKQLQGRLGTMVRLICGEFYERYSNKNYEFDVVSDAFEFNIYQDTGETERVLVVVLVLLANMNCGTIQPQCRDKLYRALKGVDVTSGQFPDRVTNAIRQVQNNTGPTSIVAALRDLLQARDDEQLFRCSWQWEQGKTWRQGLQHDRISRDLGFLSDKILSSNAASADRPSSPTTSAYSVEPSSPGDQSEPTETWDVPRFSEDQLQLAENEQRTSPSTDLEHQISDDTGREERQAMPQEGPLAEFTVDDSMCSICGVNFSQSAQSLDETLGFGTDDQGTEASSPGSVGQPSGEVKQLITAEEHCRSFNHTQQMNGFNIYKKLFLNTLSPLLDDIRAYLADVEQDVKYQCVRDAFAIKLSRLSSQADTLKEMMNQTQLKKTWGETRDMCLQEQSLETDFMELRARAEKVFRDYEKQRQEAQKAMTEEEEAVMNAEINPVDGEVSVIQKVAEEPDQWIDVHRKRKKNKPNKNKRRQGRGRDA